MWNVFEMLAVQMALTVLKLVIKSPKGTAEEAAVVAQVAQLATQADTAVNGASWSYTQPPAPAKA